MDPRGAAEDVLGVLRDAGHTAYLAGGCVRDTLLGLTPSDHDVATDATPDRVRALFPRSNAVGAAFGVVLVHHGRGPQRVTTEVATFREDGAYGDGRRPDSVTFSDAEADARRRDFTINGLFATGGGPDRLGEVVDFVGGRADLTAGVLRAIGNPAVRFEEDHLRVLRAARFTARFGLAMDPATEAAAAAAAPRVARLAPERVADELRRITAAEPDAAEQGLRWLDRLGVTAALFPDAPDPTQNLAGLPPAERFALALLRRCPDPAVAVERLRLSNAEAALLRDAAACAGALHGWPDLDTASRKRLAARPGFRVAARLADAPDVQADAERLAADGVGLAPPPLLTGDALVAAGVRPGPAMGRLLHHIYDRQLAGEFRDAEAALQAALARDAEGQGAEG